MFFLLLSLISSQAHACSTPIEGASCPPYILTMTLSNQQLHLSNHQRFSDSFDDIGFDPKFEGCMEWETSIRLFNGGKEFLATSINRDTGETWTISEKDDLQQTREAHEPRKEK